MRKKKKIILILLAVLAILAGGCRYVFRYSLYFPVWKPAEEWAVNPKVQLEFQSIEDKDTRQSVIRVGMECQEKVHLPPAGSPSHWVDIYHGGKWYTVYESPTPYLADDVWGLEPGEHQVSRTISKKIAQWKGLYRLYINDWGYCEFEVK